MGIRSPAHAHFGHAIRQIRNELGLSQEDLAGTCELDRTYISGIERGTRNPSLTNILKIADALRVSPVELFARVEAAGEDAGERHPSKQREIRLAD